MMIIDQGQVSSGAGNANLGSSRTIPFGEAVMASICKVSVVSRQMKAADVDNRAYAAMVGRGLKRALI